VSAAQLPPLETESVTVCVPAAWHVKLVVFAAGLENVPPVVGATLQPNVAPDTVAKPVRFIDLPTCAERGIAVKPSTTAHCAFCPTSTSTSTRTLPLLLATGPPPPPQRSVIITSVVSCATMENGEGPPVHCEPPEVMAVSESA